MAEGGASDGVGGEEGVEVGVYEDPDGEFGGTKENLGGGLASVSGSEVGDAAVGAGVVFGVMVVGVTRRAFDLI